MSASRRNARVALALTLLAGLNTIAAQTPSSAITWAASLGPAFHTTPSDGHLFPIGPAGSLSLRWAVVSRLTLTLEGHGFYFPEWSDHDHAPCPTTVPCHPPVGPVTVGAVIGGLQWADPPVGEGDARTYILLGSGLYRALQHPTGSGATRIGWTAGFGFILRRAEPRLALEIRYHQLPRWPRDRMSILPFTLTVVW